MDFPLKWTKFKIIFFLSVGYVCSENILPGSSPITNAQKGHREFPKESPNTNNASPTPQLLNTLLTIAAANGVLPEILPKIQPLGIAAPEALASAQEAQKSTQSASAQQPMHLYQREPVIEAARPMISTYPNNITPSQIPATHVQARSKIPVQPIVISPGLNQVTQKSNPFVSPITELKQTPPPDTFTQSNKEVKISSMLPEQPKSNPVEVTGLKPEPIYTDSITATENGQSFPINLQISIPTPNVEAPHITFINAAYPTPPIESISTQNNPQSYPNWFSYAYVPPTPPLEIIVKKKKSWLKDLLPLLIFSKFKNERENCNDKCCCCSCNSRKRNIPVPFPIPIPTNNPVINLGGSNLSGYKNDDD